MITIEDVYQEIQSIRSDLDKVLKKNQPLNQSSVLGIDDDLIDRINSEVCRLQIEDELIPGCFNEEIALNKASYYFEHYQAITNKRAYLVKLLAQIPRFKPGTRSTRESEPGEVSGPGEVPIEKPELTDKEIDDLLYKYLALSDDDVKKILFDNQKVMWLVNGIPRENYKAFHKVILAKKGLEMGLIK